MVKIPERTKDFIALIEGMGGLYITGLLLYYKPELLVKIFRTPSLFYPYAIITSYLFLDGYFRLVLRPHKSITEMIGGRLKRYLKPYSRWWRDKKPMKEKEAREEYRWYGPLYHTLLLKSI